MLFIIIGLINNILLIKGEFNMKKILIVLCAVLMGHAAQTKASVFVTVTEPVFDGIVTNHLYYTTNPQVPIIEKTYHSGYQYILYLDGFYYRTMKQIKKTFANPKVNVIPTQAVSADKQENVF